MRDRLTFREMCRQKTCRYLSKSMRQKWHLEKFRRIFLGIFFRNNSKNYWQYLKTSDMNRFKYQSGKHFYPFSILSIRFLRLLTLPKKWGWELSISHVTNLLTNVIVYHGNQVNTYSHISHRLVFYDCSRFQKIMRMGKLSIIYVIDPLTKYDRHYLPWKKITVMSFAVVVIPKDFRIPDVILR